MFCFVDDYVWTSLQVGNLDEKNTEKILGGTTFEESISLLIYDLASDKVSSGRQLQLPFFFCAYAHCYSFAKLRCKPKILRFWKLLDLLQPRQQALAYGSLPTSAQRSCEGGQF